MLDKKELMEEIQDLAFQQQKVMQLLVDNQVSTYEGSVLLTQIANEMGDLKRKVLSFSIENGNN